MSDTRPRRKLTLDLTALLRSANEVAQPTPVEQMVADQATLLVDRILRTDFGGNSSVRTLARLTDEVWAAAHHIADGGMEAPHLRAAAETVDDEAFDAVQHSVSSLPFSMDPNIAGEFI